MHGQVRAMEREDVDKVCRLFLKVFRGTDATPSPALTSYWESLFFGSPRYHRDNGGLVHAQADGSIDAAIAFLPMDMQAAGRLITARLLVAFMAETREGRRQGDSLALSLRARYHDLALSDTALPMSADMAQAGGGHVLPLQSQEWFRVFRPFGMAVTLLTRRLPRLKGLGLQRLARPFDAVAARVLRRRKIEPSSLIDFPASVDEFLDFAPAMVRHYAIHPVWSREELTWLIGQAAANSQHGPLNLRKLVDRAGRIVGGYAYFGAAGETALVLNILSVQRREREVVPAVMAGLDAAGVNAARGMLLPRQAEYLFRVPGMIFRHRAYAIALSRHRDVNEALQRGDVYMGGLAGESWSRLVTDHF